MIQAKLQMVLGVMLCVGTSAMVVHVAVSDAPFEEPDPAVQVAPSAQAPRPTQGLSSQTAVQRGTLLAAKTGRPANVPHKASLGNEQRFLSSENTRLSTSSLGGKETIAHVVVPEAIGAPNGRPAPQAGLVQTPSSTTSGGSSSSGGSPASASSPSASSFSAPASSVYSSSAAAGSSQRDSSGPAASTGGSSGAGHTSGGGGSHVPSAEDETTEEETSNPAREANVLSLEYIGSPDSDIDEVLPLLDPLPKVHYYWPPAESLINDRDNANMLHLTRITHTQCVSGEYTNARQIDTCVYRCIETNRLGPDLPASIGVNFSPWCRKFDASLPSTDRGPTYYAEIDYFAERARYVRQWVQESNLKYDSDIQVTALLMDSERFERRTDDPAWNQGMTEALDAIHAKAREIFPDATIVWYGRGMVLSAASMWPRLGYWWTGEEQTQVLSCSLYTVPDLERMRLVFSATVEYGLEKGLSRIIPYLALGAGYERRGNSQEWRPHWPYDISHSHAIGEEIHVGGANAGEFPLNDAEAIVFYPPPFRSTAADWSRHFAAYVLGASQITHE